MAADAGFSFYVYTVLSYLKFLRAQRERQEREEQQRKQRREEEELVVGGAAGEEVDWTGTWFQQLIKRAD